MTENGKTRVLIVDDSIGICRTMAMIFNRKGFDADYTLDGAKAIEAVKKADYGVIFMDIKMPGMDGSAHTGRSRRYLPMSELPSSRPTQSKRGYSRLSTRASIASSTNRWTWMQSSISQRAVL